MTRIWNPYTFTPLGNPIVGEAPPVLRVLGGMQATAQQLSYAQQRFTQFVMQARLSTVPNPTEAGRLPDGTQYRIVKVGPLTTMEIWPAGAEAEHPRGVGVEALFTGSPKLFILTYIRGSWRARAVDEFYGGSGLWVGVSGRYLTDDSLAQGAVTTTARRFRPGTADVTTPIFATSVRRGLAYSPAGGTPGVGMFTHAGKYALVSPSPFALSADIREAASLPESEFVKTPDVAAATPVYVTTVAVAPLPGLQILGVQSGRGGSARLRSGSSVVFPVIDNLRVARIDPGLGAWLAGAPITHEFWVDFQTGGSYSARLQELSGVGSDDWHPSEPGPVFTEWTASYTKRMDNTLSGSVTMATVTFSNGATSSTPATWGHTAQRSFVARFERGFKTDRIVYASRDWADKPLRMTVEDIEEYTADVNRTGREDYVFTSLSPNGKDEVDLSFPAGEVLSQEPALEEDRPFEGYDIGRGGPVGGSYSGSGTATIDYRIKKQISLNTPWGQSLKLLDQDVTYTQVRDGNMHLSEYTVSASATGRSIHREVKFIDPLLRVVAFVELEAGGFTASGNVMGTTDSTAKFIIQCAGSELLAFDLPAPNEQFVSVGSPPDIFSGFMSVSSWFIDWESAGSRVSRPLSFPGQYVYLEPGGVRVYVGYTRTIETGPLDYYETSTAPRLLATASQPTTRAPRPTMPGTGFGVSVRAAIDPNSGGGVVVVHDGETFKGGWAIAPNGAVTVLAAHLRRNGVAPEHIQKLAVSV